MHPKTQGPPRSSLGALVPRVPQNSAVPLIYGAPEVFSAPEFGDTLSFVGCPVGIWGSPSFVGCLGTSSTPKLRVPRGPQNSGVPLFYGVPSVLSTLKPGGGVRVYPQSRGAPPLIACPGPVCAPKHEGPTRTPKFGVPLLYGVPGYLVCPKTRRSPSFLGCPRPICTPKLGGPLLYGASWAHLYPKTGGGPVCTPKLRDPLSAVPWLPWAHAHPKSRGALNAPRNSGVPHVYGVSWAHVHPKFGGPICTPKLGGPPLF